MDAREQLNALKRIKAIAETVWYLQKEVMTRSVMKNSRKLA